jgi:ribosomal protein S18 acetylase RimI-like enzyme
MSEIKIIEVSEDSILELQELGVQTFCETFADLNSAENMNKYLEANLNLDKLKAELQDPGSKFYFALVDGQKAGYLKINFGQSQSELKDQDSMEIERIYVLRNHLGKKIGQALFEKAVSYAKDRGYAYIWLGVWEENRRAIEFYRKNGFVEFDKHIFILGDDVQTDIMMRLDLAKQS